MVDSGEEKETMCNSEMKGLWREAELNILSWGRGRLRQANTLARLWLEIIVQVHFFCVVVCCLLLLLILMCQRQLGQIFQQRRVLLVKELQLCRRYGRDICGHGLETDFEKSLGLLRVYHGFERIPHKPEEGHLDIARKAGVYRAKRGDKHSDSNRQRCERMDSVRCYPSCAFASFRGPGFRNLEGFV